MADETIVELWSEKDTLGIVRQLGFLLGNPERSMPEVATLPPWTVVHLHGGSTPAYSDGWAENVMAPGQTAVYDYPLHQRATLLWYHDHAMGITQFNVSPTPRPALRTSRACSRFRRSWSSVHDSIYKTV